MNTPSDDCLDNSRLVDLSPTLRTGSSTGGTPAASRTLTCPVCNGTTRRPAPDSPYNKMTATYRASDNTLACNNCGGQTMSLTATGKVHARRDTGEPCRHEYVGRNAGRCYTEYACKHCPDTYAIDSGD